MSIFQKLSFADPYDGAIFLPSSDISPIFPAPPTPPPAPESDALGQWEFGVNNSSLTSIISTRTLTPLSLSNLPTYAKNYLTPVAGGLYGLISNIADTGAPWTHWAVVQYKSTGGTIFGTTTSGSADGGAMLWVNSSNGYLTSTVRGFGSGIAKVPTEVADDDWIFVALSISTTGMVIYIGNSDVIPVTGTYTPPTSMRYHGVGSTYHAGTNFYGTTLNHASHGVHGTAKTQSELDGIYGRVKRRLADRGITVK